MFSWYRQIMLDEAKKVWELFYKKYASYEKRLCEKVDLNTLLKPVESEKLNTLEAALKNADWDNAIFDEPDLPHYILTLHLSERASFQQFATVMERWQTFADFPHIKTYKILDEKGDFTEEANNILLKVQNNLRYLKEFDEEQLKHLKYLIATLPESEQIFYTTAIGKIGKEKVTLANSLVYYGAILITEDGNILHLSAGLYDALGLVRYGLFEYVRPLHRFGKATMDDVEEGMRGEKHLQGDEISSEENEENLIKLICMYLCIRISALNFPGLVSFQNLHDYPDSDVTAFEATSHDRYHSIVASTLPKILMLALGYFVDGIRSYTGLKWAKEIWTFIDAEMLLPLTLVKEKDFSQFSNKELTELFCNMLEAGKNIKFRGLISDNKITVNFIILLLEMHRNSERWHQLRIETDFLPHIFKFCYEIVAYIYPRIKNDVSKIQILKVVLFFDLLNLHDLFAEASEPGYQSTVCPPLPNEVLAKADKLFGVIENVINGNQTSFTQKITFKKSTIRKKFDLLLLAKKPISSEYQSLPGSCQTAYALIEGELYCIDKRKKTCKWLYIESSNMEILKDKFFPPEVLLKEDETSKCVHENLSSRDVYLRNVIPGLINDEFNTNIIRFTFAGKILILDIIREIYRLDYLSRYPDCNNEACDAYVAGIMTTGLSLEESEEYAASFLSEAYQLQLPHKRANHIWQLFHESNAENEQRKFAKIDADQLACSLDSKKLDDLATALKEADWDNIIFNEPDLPRYASSLYLSKNISFQQLASVIERWRTLSEFSYLKTYKIVNEMGEFTEEAQHVFLKAWAELHFLKQLDEFQLEQLKHLILLLPPSEQVFYTTSLGNYCKKEDAPGFPKNDELVHVSIGVYDALRLVCDGVDEYSRPLHRLVIYDIVDILAGKEVDNYSIGETALCNPGTLKKKHPLETKQLSLEQNPIEEYRSLREKLSVEETLVTLVGIADKIIEITERSPCDNTKLNDFIAAIKNIAHYLKWREANDLFDEDLRPKWFEFSNLKRDLKKFKKLPGENELSSQLVAFFAEYRNICDIFMNELMKRHENVWEDASEKYQRYQVLINELIQNLPTSSKKELLQNLLKITDSIFEKVDNQLLKTCNEILKQICLYERHRREQDWPITLWKNIYTMMKASVASEESLNAACVHFPVDYRDAFKQIMQVLIPLYQLLSKEIENIIEELEELKPEFEEPEDYNQFSTQINQLLDRKLDEAKKLSVTSVEADACQLLNNRYRLHFSAESRKTIAQAGARHHSVSDEVNPQKEKESEATGASSYKKISCDL